METMTVLEPFEEYEGEKRVRREKGEEISVAPERADQLRERGLARKKPRPAEKPAAKPDPEPAV
ncbi:hypothetical protein ACP4J4_01725 [Aureimonas ureilytica]|uniref:hypothetical protein n=1 Tax=Aureimonas ureilytica TaxID=401562 RepID=UPI003CFA807E